MTSDVPPGGSDEAVVPPGGLRASHEDRDRAVERLRIAAGDGRLTGEELDQRLERALTARTVGDLDGLTRDLPAGPAVGGDRMAATPKDVLRIERAGGSTRRDGPWIVPRRIEVLVGWGSVTLDFTEAVITLPVLEIDARVRSGKLTLLTLPGTEVDADEVAVRSSGRVDVGRPPAAGGPPALRIVVSGTVGSGRITARQRRSLLRRRGRPGPRRPG
jgi:hypothetical protein